MVVLHRFAMAHADASASRGVTLPDADTTRSERDATTAPDLMDPILAIAVQAMMNYFRYRLVWTSDVDFWCRNKWWGYVCEENAYDRREVSLLCGFEIWRK